MTEPSPPSAVRVWDLPTRLFHWLLAATVVGAFITAWIGGNAMVWHMRCGLLALALLVFRIVWGLVGGHWSRFASFLYGPATIGRYLRGDVREGDHFEVGHNPLGSLSVFGLLTLLAIQVATGLVADDEIATQGPLNKFVPSDKALAATGWHHQVGQWILLLLVALHIGAIVFYRVRKNTDLVRPMLTGDKTVAAEGAAPPPSVDSMASRLLALAVGAACAALAVWVSRQGS